MSDPLAYTRESNTIENPALIAAAISPHDTNNLTHNTRGIYIGSDGDITVDMVGGGTTITFTGVVAGTILPIQVSRVYQTDTSSTGLVGLR